MVANIGAIMVATADEKNEAKLRNILKRIGYRDVVDLWQKGIISLLSSIICYIPFCIVLLLFFCSYVNLFLGLIYLWMLAFEMFLLETILQYSLKGNAKLVVKLGYYGI